MRNDESTTKVYIWAVRTIPTANMIRKTLTKEYSLLTTKAANLLATKVANLLATKVANLLATKEATILLMKGYCDLR